MSALKITTRTGIVCPKCGEAFDFKTEGLFGGVIVQLIMQGALAAIKRIGKSTIECTCHKCKHEFVTNIKER